MHWGNLRSFIACNSAILAVFASPVLAQTSQISQDGDATVWSQSQILFAIILSGTLILTAVLIARRFFALRDERDAALERVRTLETLAERDPLTGLLNRRVVEERFTKLRSQGFDTFALIDLDKFKLINDSFGHQIGDQVLVVCAEAIRGGDERDCIAIRLGGEEFVVLLRGEDAYDRAEAMRQSIPEKVAQNVRGLGAQVTASMGLIELPRAEHDIVSFAQLYARADQLLYNAKASGRDRTCFERLTVFNDAPQMRRESRRAAYGRKGASTSARTLASRPVSRSNMAQVVAADTSNLPVSS